MQSIGIILLFFCVLFLKYKSREMINTGLYKCTVWQFEYGCLSPGKYMNGRFVRLSYCWIFTKLEFHICEPPMYVVGPLTNLTHNTRIYKNFKIIWNIGMENIMHNWKINIFYV